MIDVVDPLIFKLEIQGDDTTRFTADDKKQLAAWIEHLVQSRIDHWTHGAIPKVTVQPAHRVNIGGQS